MTDVGDAAAWADRFRSFDDQFLRCVISVWPRCLAALPPQPDEDAITSNLVRLLLRDQDTLRQFHWVEFQYVPFGETPEGAAERKGQIDMAVFLNQDRDLYLAYECKRLNVRRGGGRRSLAREYVQKGLSRFVSGQYSQGLPVGCMLGYVLDGDLEHAASKVRARIVEYGHDVALVAGPEDADAIGISLRFWSRHRRERHGGEIEIRHALLPMGRKRAP